MAGRITSLIVKIGAQDAEITAALAKLGSNVKRTEAEFKKLGASPIATQAQQSLKTLDDTVKQITTSQQRLADRAKIAAAGLTAIGGPARVTKNELEQINRTIQSGLDAYRALGQKAPVELQKVADAVTRQRKSLADASAGGGAGRGGTDIAGLLGAAGISTGLLTGAGVVAALGAGARAALSYADSLTKLSDRTGISAEQLQRLDAVASASGNTVDQVADAVNQFQKRLVEESDATTAALSSIGLSVSELRALSPDDQFFAIAKALQTIPDPAEQAATAMQIFGRSGAELLPTLKADIDALADSTVKMSDESVKALDDLGDAFGRVGRNAISAIGEAAGQMLAAIQAADKQAVLDSRANQFAAGFRTGDVKLQPGLSVPAGFDIQAKIAQTNAALAQSSADTATAQGEVTRAFEESRKAVEAHNAALKKAADQWSEIEQASRPYVDVLADINDGTRDVILAYAAQGADVRKLADAYGLTASQADALSEALKFNALMTRAAAAAQGTLAKDLYAVNDAYVLQGRAISKIPALKAGPNAQLAALTNDAADVKQAMQGISEAFGLVAQIGGESFDGVAQKVGTLISQINLAQNAVQSLSSAALTMGQQVGVSIATVGFNILFALGAAQQRQEDIHTAILNMWINSGTAVAEYSEAVQTYIGRDVIEAYQEAIRSAKSLEEAQRALNALMKALGDGQSFIADVESSVGPSQTQLEAQVTRAREVLDYVQQAQQRFKDGRDSVAEYTEQQQLQAYYDWQKAMADAGNAAAKAWVAAQDAAENSTASASKAIDELRAKRDGLAQSIANEAPEEVMGVIESQIRGQIAALDAQLTAQQTAVDENQTQATEAAALIENEFASCWTRVGEDGKSAADAVADYFGSLDVEVNVRYKYPGDPVVPGAATGGLVVPGGIQHFDRGGVVLPFRPRGTDTVPAMLTPGEIVLNAAQQRNLAGAIGGPSVGAINVTVYPAAGEDEQQLAARVVSALRTNAVLYEAVSVVSKRAVA